ncbi:MAG: sodium ion-translocating decarboxylase subunit beta [Halomonadaceae bacterium]|nr:MAG: sodium ion-translocating decarboxylase subunit beta [Halomonadaceae bacterium]
MDKLLDLWTGSGLYNLTPGNAFMLLAGMVLLYLAINKKFEPLLLVPIGFGTVMANIPEAGLAYSAVENAINSGRADVLASLAPLLGENFTTSQAITGDLMREMREAFRGLDAQGRFEAGQLAANYGYSSGILHTFYSVAIATGIAPLLIFVGVGAMTDFGPLLANPKTMLLGAAAQFGIFGTVIGAALLDWSGILSFTVAEAAAIGIIGGADGPTSIYVSSILAPHLLGAIAVAAYSYMALVPLIQPPIMRALTTKKERAMKMVQLRQVGKLEKILFPLSILVLAGMFLPDAAPLLGMFCFGNLLKECGVVDRLSDTVQNAMINIVTIVLGLAVGAQMMAETFLSVQVLGILALGLVAFCVGTATGIMMAKLMNLLSKEQINPLIGSAGVSAVPMAARVSNKLGLEANGQNFLLMHAMGPNVAGVIGSAVAAGVMIKFLA